MRLTFQVRTYGQHANEFRILGEALLPEVWSDDFISSARL
jgi:hypothetical protein